jgi:hypothetical protein
MLAGIALGTLSLILAFSLLMGSAPNCSSVSYEGEGTAEDPYQVATVEHLNCISQDPDAHYLQVSDINAAETAWWNSGIGFRTIPFNGSYDGSEYVITDFTVDLEQKGFLEILLQPNTFTIRDSGFFSIRESGAVTNLSMLSAEVNADSYGYSGTIASVNRGNISSSYATGTLKRGGDFAGGLVGFNERLDEGGWISRSYASVNVSGGENAGGLVGEGGTIVNSYATGNVSGHGTVGGLIGDGSVKRSYATGRVSGSGDADTGGLIADNGMAVHSYWNTETTGQNSSHVPDEETLEAYGLKMQNSSYAGVGLTEEQMTGADAAKHMEGFDFADTWTTVPDGYPRLVGVERPDSGTGSRGLPDYTTMVVLTFLSSFSAVILLRV